MKIIYSNHQMPEDLPFREHSIFLAGPTPRDKQTKSWRPEALEILRKLNYKGTVLVPEWDKDGIRKSYDDQVEWEDLGLNGCKRIVFWVPRNMDAMLALTTNVEFGRFAHKDKSIYGRPDDAPKNRYLDWLYAKYNGQPIYNTLEQTLKAAI